MAETQSFTSSSWRKHSQLSQSHSSSTIDFKEQSTPKSARISSTGHLSFSELLGYQRIRNPQDLFSEDISLADASQQFKNWGNSATDRFIPLRKASTVHNLPENDQEAENSEKYLEIEPTHYQISDIYKREVMMKPVNSLQSQKKQITTFKSLNFLKYSSDSRRPLQQKLIPMTEHEEMFEELTRYQKKRIVSKVPLKVLDAPSLQNDYYLNVIDWSNDNIIAVGLASHVYLWNGVNSRVTKLCDVGVVDSVCSVSWSLKDPHLAVGSSNGEVRIWDVEKMKKVRSFSNHTNRVSAISWNTSTFCTGSRDKLIYQSDPRIEESFIRKMQGHKQEICGLKWSPDEQQFCSGGNDNKLFVWNNYSSSPIHRFADHQAAVKAVAWSPHQHGLLVSGGGTADRTIKFRNTLTGETTRSLNAGSQVCNLTFSKSLNELVSTHGYSHNEINIWRCPKMQKIATLSGHTLRVLYLAMSPDGSTIVTGAGDQTLRFWKVFPKTEKKEFSPISELKVGSAQLR